MKYTAVQEVEAVKWDGSNDEEILAIDDQIVISGEDVLVNGESLGSVGDWVVRSAGGQVAVHTDEFFQASFEPVSPQSAVAAADPATPADQL